MEGLTTDPTTRERVSRSPTVFHVYGHFVFVLHFILFKGKEGASGGHFISIRRKRELLLGTLICSKSNLPPSCLLLIVKIIMPLSVAKLIALPD